jgi:hypothetical protein
MSINKTLPLSSSKTIRISSQKKKHHSFCITNIEEELLKQNRRHSICITPTSEERRQSKMNVKETTILCTNPACLNHNDNIFGLWICPKCFMELYDKPSRCDRSDCRCQSCMWKMKGSHSLFI